MKFIPFASKLVSLTKKSVEELSKIKQKWVRSLQLKKNRDEGGFFVVEGEKMVLEGLGHFGDLLSCIVSERAHIEAIPENFHSKLMLCSKQQLEQISSLKSPNKYLAIFKQPTHLIRNNCRTIVLDGIQDPGNMGTILRLADWYGINQIVCSEDTVDCFNPKVVQATMGAIFRIAIHYTNLENYLSQTKQKKYGAMLNGTNYKSIAYETDALLIIGNEGNGIRPEIAAQIDVAITIPRYGLAESLNAGTATAILLAEMID